MNDSIYLPLEIQANSDYLSVKVGSFTGDETISAYKSVTMGIYDVV